MYKVFLNDRIIVIARPDVDLPEGSVLHYIEKPHQLGLRQIFDDFLKREEKILFLLSPEENKLWDNFRSIFVTIRAAGGMILKGGKYLFIFRRGKWDLPKGKTDKGETPEQTAVREVHEECGIRDLTITKQLPATWHIYQSGYEDSKGLWILKETVWFEMAHRDDEKLVPQTDEEITQVKWFRSDDFDIILKNTYPNLEQIIRLYL